MFQCFCGVPADLPSPKSKSQKMRQESAGERKPAGTPQKSCRGSLTVECAMALPVFFFACIILISVINAVRFQTEADIKAANKARTLAVASAASEGAPSMTSDSAAWIDLCSPHRMDMPSFFPGLPSLFFYSSARVAKWTGGGVNMPSAKETPEDDPIVFISDKRSVYHTHADCTYLNLSIYASTTEDIKKLRNTNGGKYYPCRGFPKNYRGPVYATSNGTYYYPSLNYSSLKRHVHTARLSECHDLSECIRCRGRS